MTDRELMQQALDMLKQAKDSVADWGAYASEYFQHKHNLQGSIDDIQAQITVLSERLAQPQMQSCAGRNCGSTNPNLHSAECFEDYEKTTGMNQRKPLPPQSPCEMTQSERKMFRLGWLECEAAHGIKE